MTAGVLLGCPVEHIEAVRASPAPRGAPWDSLSPAGHPKPSGSHQAARVVEWGHEELAQDWALGLGRRKSGHHRGNVLGSLPVEHFWGP